ncbi:hypothetical protein nACB2_107 [Acinetobacter phage nACB2]|nr:hypothetical protein nACB2_107 [Acinetobacter phage nACB2]
MKITDIGLMAEALRVPIEYIHIMRQSGLEFEVVMELNIESYSGSMTQMKPPVSVSVGKSGLRYDPITGGTVKVFEAYNIEIIKNLIKTSMENKNV